MGLSGHGENNIGQRRVAILAPIVGLVLSACRALPMLPVIFVTGTLVSLTVDGFMSLTNIQNTLRQLSVILIAVSGETLVILIGGIDLSLGAVIGLASVCGAFAMHTTGFVLPGVFACLAVGAAIGALNGLAISRLGLPPFILTFGMMLTVRAVAFLLTGGRSVGGLPKSILHAGRLNVAELPLVFIIGMGVAALVGLLLSRTVFGQAIYLTGSNSRAAAFSGINTRVLIFRVYLISGTLGGITAFVFMMRLGAATPTAGDPLLLQIVAAVVLGGTSLSGGEGGIIRSITGALVVAMLVKSLEILGAQFWDQMIAIGILTGLGSALGAWLGRRRASEVRTTRVYPDRSSLDQP